MFLDPGSIPMDARRRLLEEAWRLGLKPRDLGVSYSFMYQMRRGFKPVPDHIIARVIEFLDDDAVLRAAPELAPMLGIERVDNLTLDRLIRLNIEYARRNPASAKVLLETLEAELERLGIAGRIVRVTADHWREWEAYLDTRRRSGTLGYKQWQSHRIYLKRLLDSTGWLIAPGLVRRAILDVARESPKAAQKMSESVRLFVREILQDQDLYNRLPRFRARSGRTRAPGWDEICKLLGSVEWQPAKALLYLALSGLRIETLYTITVDKVDLDKRVVAPMADRRFKRDFFSFIPKQAADYLSTIYMPWRMAWLETAVKGQEALRQRFIPVKPKRIREYIYQVMDQILGYRFQLRTIRHRVTTHLALHLSKLEVDVITGHAPRDVVQAHYLQLDILEELRARYDRAMQQVPCL